MKYKPKKTDDERIKEMTDDLEGKKETEKKEKLEPVDDDEEYACLEDAEEKAGMDLDGDDEEGESIAHKEKVKGKKGLFSEKGLHIIIAMGKNK